MKRSLQVGLGMAVLAASTLSCVGIGDIDRTQANALHKDIFRDSVWYYKQTVVDVPATNVTHFVGIAGGLEKVRWDIQEKVLIAYRSYEKVPGADIRVDRNVNPANGTANRIYEHGQGEAPEEFKENPIAAFPIITHFDIKRDFNPSTGEQSNVLSENTTDRPWHQRAYMRVNWSQNLITNLYQPSPDTRVDADQSFFVQAGECDPTSFDEATGDYPRDSEGRCLKPHEDALRMECSATPGRLDGYNTQLCNTAELLAGTARPTYFDFTTKFLTFPNPGLRGACGLFGGSLAGGIYECSDSEIKVRNSFLRVTDRDYEPLEYTDLHMAKFGYFRTERLTYDRRQGQTETGRIKLADRHNIWRGTFACVNGTPDEAGLCAPITDVAALQAAHPANCLAKNEAGEIDPSRAPYGGGYQLNPETCGRVARPYIERGLRPIAYYVSPHYPADLFESARFIGQGFNRAFRRAVAAAWGYGAGIPDDVLVNQTTGDGKVYNSTVVRGIDCIPTNATGAGTYGAATVPAECSGANVAAGLFIPDMFVICHNPVEAGDDGACGEVGTYARNGDLRRNFLFWVRQPQLTGPLGFGPSFADPETGEILSGTAYMYGAGVDRAASEGADAVQLLLGEREISEIMSGSQIRQFVNSDLFGDASKFSIPSVVKNDAIPADQMVSALVGQKGLQNLANLASTTGLRPVSQDYAQKRLQVIRGTDIERMLINDEVLGAIAPQALDPNNPDPQIPNLDELSPATWMNGPALRAEAKRNLISNKNTGCIYKADFNDDSVWGLAQQMKAEADANGLSGDDRYNYIWNRLRAIIFESVGAHEVGHTVGLRHNFQGSFDSINYHPQYWQLKLNNLENLGPQSTGADMLRLAQPTGEQLQGRMREFQYSAIMDYNAPVFSADIHGIGRYEEAALIFGYTGYVETFRQLEGGLREVMNWRYSSRIRAFFSGNTNAAGFHYFINKPSVLFDGLTQSWHYSQIPYLAGGGSVRCTDGRTNRPKSSGCDPNIDSNFYVDGGDATAGINTMYSRDLVKWADLRAEQNDPEQAATSRIEVPYLFCSDEWVGNTASCHLWDQGADHLEQTLRIIDTWNNYYIFNNFARDRYNFSTSSWLARVYDRYFSYIPNIYQNWVFNYGGIPSLLANNNFTTAMVTGFNFLNQVINTPRYGSYQLVDGQYRHMSYDMGQGDMEIPMGEGRRQLSRYDFSSGYEVFRRPLEVGHFWDYIGALSALTDSSATRLGSELASNFTSFLLPYFLVFPDQMTLLSNSLVLRDCRTCVRQDAEGNRTPYLPLDPNTLRPTTPPPGTVAISPELNFTQRLYLMLYSIAFYSSGYDLSFTDQAHVFRMGAGEQITPGEGFETMSFTDPATGDAYGAIIRTGGTAANDSLAAAMVRRGAELAERVNTATGQDKVDAETQLAEHVRDVNLLRSMYQLFNVTF